MKKRDIAGYYSKKIEDIEKELIGDKIEFSKVKLNISSGREKNLKKAKNIGKKISQLMTILKIKQKEEKLKK